MEWIKQEEAFDCVAAVACMATNSSMEEFKNWAIRHPSGGYSQSTFNNWLKRFKLELDFHFSEERPKKREPAYVVVESEFVPGWTHALYWDGRQLFDPFGKSGRRISEYDYKYHRAIIKNS